MADQLLNAVIQLENRIQQQVQEEQQRAAAWLASVRRQLEVDQQTAAQLLADEEQRLLAAAAKDAARQAETLLAREMNYCVRLEGLDDESQLEVLRHRLVPPLIGSND